MTDGLANSLTPDQKAAILTALKWIGLWVSNDISGSEDLQPKSVERLEMNAELLKFNFSNSLLKKYENEDDEEMLFNTLNSMPAIIKPWFVVETYMMLSSVGGITQRAMQVTLMYCQKIGISQNMYLDIIKQAYLATGDYQEGMFD